VAARLVERVANLWLSRSWTTRAPRPGEPTDAYVFVDEPTFLKKADEGGFLEWATFLGNHYGTPVPKAPQGMDVLLEIDVQGAAQVVKKDPDATVILLLPPSLEIQRARLEGRGDLPDAVDRRLQKGVEEVAQGRALATHEVVNDELEHAVELCAGIVETVRLARKDHHGA